MPDSSAVAGPPPSRPAATLPQLLARIPWESAWTEQGAPLDFLWTWELAASAEALWPHLIDTSSFNRRLGLGEMVFEEREGKLLGQSGSGLSYLAWEEVPWHWDYLRAMGNARIYTRGFARYVRSRYELTPLEPNLTRLQVYFGWIPRTALGRYLILPQTMTWLERRFGDVLREIASSTGVAPPPAAVTELGEAVQNKIAAIRARLLEQGWDAPLLDPLLDRLRTGSDDELERIRVRSVARLLKRPLREVLRAFLEATRLGLFTLTWDVICPHCRGARQELLHLGEVSKRASCEACQIDFDATGLNALEVTFHVHPSIRRIEKRQYCAAQPARRPHILVQERVAAGQQLVLPTALPEGRYRLRLQGSFDYGLLSVSPGTVAASATWAATVRGVHLETSGGPELRLVNDTAEPHAFVIERTEEDQDALRPRDLFALQEFRDLFSEEAVGADIQLDVGTQTIVLTDIVGSTQFYEVVGDSVAFAHVRHHFIKAFEVIHAHEGVVVKTMGDAVMAAFQQPAAALKAAIALQERFRPGDADSPVRVRVSAHTGPCLAVNLNAAIDYFGSTINFCAKLQALADAGQIVFTESLARDPEVAEFLPMLAKAPEQLEFRLKWHEHPSKVFRIDVG
jgi:class 3 adenylate cyclase